VATSVRQVLRLIDDWYPRSCKTEKDFEKSLIRHLEKNLTKADIIKQYAAGRVKGDIVVDKEVLLELKQGLDSTSKVQRLLGQIEIYNAEWRGSVVIVICGKSQADLLKMVKKKVDDLAPGLLDILALQKIYMRVKDKFAPPKKTASFLGW